MVPSNEVHLLKYYFELLPFTLLHLFDTFISSSEVSDNSMKYNHQTGYFIMYYYQLKVQYVRFWLKTFKITKIINRIWRNNSFDVSDTDVLYCRDAR